LERFVHTSSSEAYGTAQYVPIDEKHPLQAQSPYAASKIAADKLAESYYLSFNLPIATLRPFNTFGPRQSLRAIIPTIISQALRDGNIHLGNMKPRRDFLFVKDTVRGFIEIGSDEPSEKSSTLNGRCSIEDSRPEDHRFDRRRFEDQD
jgi:nucleoside-diphosphate-sugar epimerase